VDLETALQKAVNRPSEKPKRSAAPKKPTKAKKAAPTNKPAVVPKRGRGGHFKPTSAWTKRITLDVTPEQNKFLATFSVEHDTKKNQVLRELIKLTILVPLRS